MHIQLKDLAQTPGAPRLDADQPLSLEALRALALEAGADDAGMVAVERSELDADRDEIEAIAPWTKTLVSFVVRMNRTPIRSPARSIANLEFHHIGDEVNDIARRLVQALEARVTTLRGTAREVLTHSIRSGSRGTDLGQVVP